MPASMPEISKTSIYYIYVRKITNRNGWDGVSALACSLLFAAKNSAQSCQCRRLLSRESFSMLFRCRFSDVFFDDLLDHFGVNVGYIFDDVCRGASETSLERETPMFRKCYNNLMFLLICCLLLF